MTLSEISELEISSKSYTNNTIQLANRVLKDFKLQFDIKNGNVPGSSEFWSFLEKVRPGLDTDLAPSPPLNDHLEDAAWTMDAVHADIYEVVDRTLCFMIERLRKCLMHKSWQGSEDPQGFEHFRGFEDFSRILNEKGHMGQKLMTEAATYALIRSLGWLVRAFEPLSPKVTLAGLLEQEITPRLTVNTYKKRRWEAHDREVVRLLDSNMLSGLPKEEHFSCRVYFPEATVQRQHASHLTLGLETNILHRAERWVDLLNHRVNWEHFENGIEKGLAWFHVPKTDVGGLIQGV